MELALFGSIPVVSNNPEFNSIGVEEVEAVTQFMRGVVSGSESLSGFLGRAGDRFLGGKNVRNLEKRFERYFGSRHAVSFNSATTALQAAVTALEISAGDEVITTPFTMPATATAIYLAGATPVFADIDPDTYCIDPEDVESKITQRTKAILAVNLFGGSADYEKLCSIASHKDLWLIEDNAQAPGGRFAGNFTGTIGDVGVFSFNVHKTMQCGEGGMLVTDDDSIAEKAALIRNHGEAVIDDLFETNSFANDGIAGSNFRLSEIHAVIAIEQLLKLKEMNSIRVSLAENLSKELAHFDWIESPHVPPNVNHVFYRYPFKIRRGVNGVSSETITKALRAEGFRVAKGYQKPLYKIPLFKGRFSQGSCPVAERMYEKELLITDVVCQSKKGQFRFISQFIEALEKIEQNLDALKEYDRRE
ncbi:MAG: pyridoxal-5'-phosphate-dependent protein [Candidatus Harrisonbacteria bacterium CG10_big_fil_rev_8_21_14_0_10_40_38]|uniref:Pyridoxal-5'-phosphate-dependent protein n=1 Tax=Candidatus Harrisonbacteria bacterium CG10_big_fil_rev_8_21_14_0_10_40_38 TaxID=1974583 RepID=A0A2H0URN0_9BACT|nr:MAG: pyridoxal-5'-phosphate-dependent protein [Candidatus Harrisonbacteria bacterium CG10_big_fil_rev_8_21_14_0_10_40_38]